MRTVISILAALVLSSLALAADEDLGIDLPKLKPPEEKAPEPKAPEIKLCDLDVLYVQRTPRYPGYLPSYDLPGHQGEPLLVKKNEKGEPILVKKDGKDEPVILTPAEAAAIQHWPKEGEVVTYTAVVENKGAADAPPFEFAWYLDDKQVLAGKTENGLKVGERTEIKYEMPWKRERRRIEFWADPMRRVRQVSFANDRRTVWSHAKLLVCYCDSRTYAQFAKYRNFLGTMSFEDWCQAHADWMNLLFERSVYPKTVPEGIADRVAVDWIGVCEDQAAWEARWKNGPPLSEGWDGAWWFGRNEKCAEWAAGMDWGLIHEWGHQFGLTDLYCLDVACEGNHVRDKAGAPLAIGRMSVFAGTMMHGHGPVLFSEDQAIALNHQLWRRRGYYGDYYYHLAEKNCVLVTDAAGKPVAGARVRVWQRTLEQLLEGEPTFTGETGPDGRMLLPNRPAPHVVTYGDEGGGYELKANPFGLINVVGSNDVLFVEIAARGQTDYAFLEVTQFNVARERDGPQAATVTVPTPLPAEGATAAPLAPKAETNGNEVTLKLAGQDAWTALRADPIDYVWKKIGEAKGGTFIDKLPHSGLFRYAATVEVGGKPSARSEPVGVASMVDPWGLAVGPEGVVYIRDRANGQTLVIRADGSAAGYVGSVHWHLEGSSDHATDAKGLLYVAKWPDGYDPKRAWIRRIDPNGKGREHDRQDLAGGPSDAGVGHFKGPMGIWVSPKDGRVVVADTGNDRVQILAADGKENKADRVEALSHPGKALLVGENLVVCDTGAKRVVVYEKKGGAWAEMKVFDGFEEPVYACIGLNDHVWIADHKLGRVFAIVPEKWTKLDWCFPAAAQPKLDDLRGIGYDPRGDLLYIDGKAKRLGWRHVLD